MSKCEHVFPRVANYELLGTGGKRIIWSCNNCLSIKVHFINDVKVNDKWTTYEKTVIVDCLDYDPDPIQ